MLCDVFYIVQSLNNFFFVFKNERDGNDFDSQDVYFFSDMGDDGSGFGFGFFIYFGSDKYYFGIIVQQSFDVFDVFFGSIMCMFWMVFGIEFLCDGMFQLQFDWYGRFS